MVEWKEIAYELYCKQEKKDIKGIKEILKSKYGVEINYEYIKSYLGKRRRGEIKSCEVVEEVKEEKPQKKAKEEKLPTPDVFYNEYQQKWEQNKTIRFGIVSDTHLCSKHQQLTFLNTMYDRFEREGIKTVYHAGDITEGYKMRAGQEHEVFKHGADEQIDYTISVYPKREGMKTYFIIGNHDLSHIKSGGIDIGKKIARERKDMIYLGALNAKIFLTPNCTMELNHPLDGASYALSYSIQKMADSYSGDAKPNILVNGHHHKLFYCFYRNIHCVEAGTFEAQTPWMRGKRIAAHVGGLIINIEVDKSGTITRFVPEFIPFYSEVKHDY